MYKNNNVYIVIRVIPKAITTALWLFVMYHNPKIMVAFILLTAFHLPMCPSPINI